MEFFQYLAPTKVIFGRGTEARVGELCKEQGAKKVLMRKKSAHPLRRVQR